MKTRSEVLRWPRIIPSWLWAPVISMWISLNIMELNSTVSKPSLTPMNTLSSSPSQMTTNICLSRVRIPQFTGTTLMVHPSNSSPLKITGHSRHKIKLFMHQLAQINNGFVFLTRKNLPVHKRRMGHAGTVQNSRIIFWTMESAYTATGVKAIQW